MTPTTFQLMVALFSVWGAAIVVKAVTCLRSGEPYVFSMWDGGLIRVGKRINKMGTQIKVVVGAMISGGGIAALGGLLPLQAASGILIFFGVLSVVSDFVCADKS
jgi:hypothetical protein